MDYFCHTNVLSYVKNVHFYHNITRLTYSQVLAYEIKQTNMRIEALR